MGDHGELGTVARVQPDYGVVQVGPSGRRAQVQPPGDRRAEVHRPHPRPGTLGYTARIAGEVFDPGDSLQLYLSPAALAVLAPGSGPQQYDAALRRGTSPQSYANAVPAALGESYQVTNISGGTWRS